MSTPEERADRKVWAALDREARRDRLIRRVAVIAWSLTFLAVLIYAGATAAQVNEVRRLVAVGAAPTDSLYLAVVPLVGVIGVLSVLIATLATVGMFLRMRTASLLEIQQRLAALEAILASRADDGK